MSLYSYDVPFTVAWSVHVSASYDTPVSLRPLLFLASLSIPSYTLLFLFVILKSKKSRGVSSPANVPEGAADETNSRERAVTDQGPG